MDIHRPDCGFCSLAFILVRAIVAADRLEGAVVAAGRGVVVAAGHRFGGSGGGPAAQRLSVVEAPAAVELLLAAAQRVLEQGNKNRGVFIPLGVVTSE